MQTLELAQKLIKLKKFQPGPEKDEAVELIASVLKKGGLHVEIIESKGVKNVIGSTRGRKEKTKKLIFNGHYDTVPPSAQWSVDPFEPAIKNGFMWGLGSLDMTCNLAAMINTAIEISKKNPTGEVVIVAVGDEETGGFNGTKATIEKGVVGNYAVIGEPTTMRLATGHKARIQLELTAEGKGGHAAYPREGKNAIHEMADCLSMLAGEFEPSSHYHEYIFSHPTMNATLISGGTAQNVVPFQCKATIDFRIPPTMNEKKFVEQIEKKLPKHIKISSKGIGLGWASDENSTFVKTAEKTLEQVTGTEMGEHMHKLGASDARFYHAAGIPTINVGAGQMHLHVPDEKIEWKQVEQVEKFYYKLCKKTIG